MNNSPTFLVTGKARLSFVHLFQPHANQQGAEPKYSTTILVPKSDVQTKARIDAAIQAAIQAGVSSKWNGVRPPQVSICVHDGDGVRPSDGMPFGDECKGHWVFTASSKQAPQIVDANMNPIINQSEVYSGCYARVSVNFFPYNNAGKKGIGCGLGNVQKLEDGEPLGGRTTAADDFGTFAPAAPQFAQPYGQAAPVQQPMYQQPYQAPAQPAYNAGQFVNPVQPVQPVQPQINPITGQPVTPIMGINQ